MENQFKRFLSLLVAMVMIIGMLPGNVFASETTSDNYVAMIGDKTYETLTAAVTAANGMTGDVVISICGQAEYADDTPNLTGGYDSISFVGTSADAEISITRNGSGGYISGGGNDCTVSFTDLTLRKPTGYYANDAGYMNLYFAVYRTGDVTYTNCTFPDGACAQGGTVKYTGCTFNNKTSGEYSLWVYGMNTECVVDGCTFSGVRGIKMYSEGTDDYADLTITNSTFTDNLTEKAAVVLTKGSSIALTGNTYNNSKGAVAVNDDYVAGTSGTTDVVIEGTEYVVADGALVENSPAAAVATVNGVEYTSLQEALNASAAGSGSVTVEILSDIDLSGTDWAPVTVSAPGYPVVTVNGNSKTITGLNDMLFAGTWAGNSGLIINDLTIKDSKIENDVDDEIGTVGVGAFIGYPQASATITLNNCHLVDSTVSGGHWTGGLIGIAGGYNGNDGPVFMNLTITGCSVTGSTITGKGSAGGVIGHGSCAAWTNVVIENTTVSDNTITSTGSSANKAGSVMGTIGAAGQPATADGETKTGGASISVTTENNTVTSNGTTITTIYGRQGSETGMLTVTGGTYEAYPIEEGVSYAAPAEGCVIEQNEDGVYGVVADPAYGKVAKVGDAYYETLAAAFAAAQKGSTITLLDNITLTEGVSIMDPDVLSDITLDGNGRTITLDMNGTGTGIRFGGEWATGVKIHDLTVEGSANYAIWLNGGTSSALTNVTVKGEYNDVYGALILYGTHGATLTNCDIVSGFVNGQDDYPLNLVNSRIGSLTANVSEAEDGAKVFLDADSSIESLLCGGDSTVMIDYASLERVGSYTTEEGDVVAQVGDVKYATLRAAVDAAADGQTVELLTDITMTGTIEVEKDITIDLGGHTITNNGGSGNHTFRIAADVIVKNGTVDNTAGGYCMIVGYNTPVAGNLTVESGTYYGSTTAISVTYGTATVLGGYFRVYTGGTENYTYTFNCVDRFYDAGNAAITVKGGTFYSFDPMNNGAEGEGTSFVAEGYAALPDLNGNYVVGTEPTAEVNDLGEMTIPAGDYYIYDGSLTTGTEDMPLNFVMQFVAHEDAEDMLTSPFADWYADFVITFEGIEGGSFNPTGCYLAGYYGSTDSWDGLWVKIPVGGQLSSIEEGTRYPVMTGVGMPQTYDYICSGVQAFSCAMYIPEQILTANPNLKVRLELNVVDSSDAELALKALQTGDKIYNVSETSYTAEDFLSGEAAVVSKETGKLTAYPTLNVALAAAKAGDTVKLLADVTASEIILIDKSITVNGNGHTLTSTAGRAINVDTTETVTIKDLVIVGGTGCQRGINVINQAGITNLENVNISGISHYAVHVATSAGAAKVNIADSQLTGYAALAVYGAGSVVDVTDSDLTGINEYADNGSNGYAAVISDAADVKITVTGGSVTAQATEGKAPQAIVGSSIGTATIVLDTQLTVEGTATYVAADPEAVELSVREEYAQNVEAEGFVVSEPVDGMVRIESVAVACVNGTNYETINEAFAAAEAGDTVKLLVDCTTDDLFASVPADVTLDLNGNVWTVENNLWAFGHIVDGTAGGEGGLVVSGNAILDENNTFLPLYDTALGGYRFFSYGLRARGVRTSGSGETLMFTYGFAVDFDNADAYLLMKDAANSGLELKVDLKWTDMPDNKAVTYTITDATVADFAENAYEDVAVEGSELTSYVMAVRVTGLSSFSAGTEVTATMNIHAAMKVISDGAPLVGTIGG